MVELQADAYYYEILECNDFSKLGSILPNKEQKEFENIMKIVIQKLQDDLKSLYELREEKTSNEEELAKEIDNLKLKIDFCENHLHLKAKEENHIIFAKSGNDQILPLSDIENIDSDYYSAISGLLEKLQREERTNNPKKQKILTNNKAVKGVKELKDNQVRVLYKTINNVSFVFLIMIKKDDWSKKDDNKVDTRLKTVQNYYDYLDQLDEKRLEEELINNSPIYEDIIDVLKPQKVESKEVKETPKAVTQTPKKPGKTRYDKTPEFKELDKEWKFYYNIAIKVKRLEGTINVKTVYRYNDIEIGRWIKAQKDAYDTGLLSAYQIGLLEGLEIRWHQKTKENVEILTLEPPKSKVIKTRKRLAQIPAVKSKLELKWSNRYGLAKQFYEEYHHLRIPQNYVMNGVNLGTWINTQRQKYKKGKMPLDKIKLLESIGMLWEIYNTKSKDFVDEEMTEKEEERKLNEVIIQIYQDLYKMSKEDAEDFVLRLENDDEGIYEIGKRQK